MLFMIIGQGPDAEWIQELVLIQYAFQKLLK